MTEYTSAIATATRLVDKKGRSVTVQKLNVSASDPSKPWQGQNTQTVDASEPARAVFVPPSGSGFGRDLISEDNIKRVEQVALIAQTPNDIQDYDAILDTDGSLWSVVFVQVLKPGDEIVLYAFGVKR